MCCGDAHWCIFFFEIVLLFCRWDSRSIFPNVRIACEVLLWPGPWSRMTRNSSVDDCVPTVDSPTLTRSVALRCFFRGSTHVRYDRILAAIAHLKLLHAAPLHHSHQSRANCWFASNTAARGPLGRFHPFCRYVVAVSTLRWRFFGSSRISCVVRSRLLRFICVSRVCFFTRHCLLLEPTIYLVSART